MRLFMLPYKGCYLFYHFLTHSQPAEADCETDSAVGTGISSSLLSSRLPGPQETCIPRRRGGREPGQPTPLGWARNRWALKSFKSRWADVTHVSEPLTPNTAGHVEVRSGNDRGGSVRGPWHCCLRAGGRAKTSCDTVAWDTGVLPRRDTGWQLWKAWAFTLLTPSHGTSPTG